MRIIRKFNHYYTGQEWADLRRAAKAARRGPESIGAALRRLLVTHWVATTYDIAYGFHSDPQYGMTYVIPGAVVRLWNHEDPEVVGLLNRARESALARAGIDPAELKSA